MQIDEYTNNVEIKCFIYISDSVYVMGRGHKKQF
jgi:hypothetical protein